jgi:glutaredoxin
MFTGYSKFAENVLKSQKINLKASIIFLLSYCGYSKFTENVLKSKKSI